MKLYYMPGTCSLAVHIALNEIGASFALEPVDGKTKRTAAGEDFRAINPNGYVPALKLESGDVLLEAPAILQYVADRKPEAGLAPEAGTLERVRLQQHLNFAASELHKSFAPFFAAEPPEGKARDAALAKLRSRMSHVEHLLSDDRPFVMGETFTVADVYFAVIATWTSLIGVDLEDWPRFAAFTRRVTSRPAADEAMRREGLLN
jgi:glutathione S-transferase